jgi:ribonuclease P protein component
LVRLKRSAEFEQVLGAGGKAVAARTARFVLHHVSDANEVIPTAGGQLSTGLRGAAIPVVDVSPEKVDAVRAGAIIPKRWARRSVTRSLLKRQVFSAFERHLDHLPSGMWLVRLRSSFEKAQFSSAASQALRVAVRGELDRLFAQVANRVAQPAGRSD